MTKYFIIFYNAVLIKMRLKAIPEAIKLIAFLDLLDVHLLDRSIRLN